MGCFHVRNVLPGQWWSGKASPAPPLAERSDAIAETGVCVASGKYSVPAAKGASELKDHVPGKYTANPWRIYTFKNVSNNSPNVASFTCVSVPSKDLLILQSFLLRMKWYPRSPGVEQSDAFLLVGPV